MNKIILSGNLCKDMDLKYYGDKHCLKNSIAVRRDFKNKNGEYDTDFYNFTVWGKQAEFINQYAVKGNSILLSGKILNNNYEKDGRTVYATDVQVESIEILTKKGEKNEIEKEFGDKVEIADNFLD